MRQQDQERFMSLYAQAQPSLRLYLLSVVGDLRELDDLLQDVSVALLRRFEAYDPQRPFLYWAVGVARREVLKKRRDFARHPLVLDTELVERLADRVTALRPELDAQALHLRGCVERLPPQQRAVVRMRYEDGQRIEGIAARLERNEAAVYMLLSRIRAALADCVRGRLAREAADAV